MFYIYWPIILEYCSYKVLRIGNFLLEFCPVYFTPQVHKKQPYPEPQILNETNVDFKNKSKYNGFNKFNNTQNYNQTGKNDKLFNTVQNNDNQYELGDNFNTTKYNKDSQKS